MANDKKISEFTQVPTFEQTDSLNIVRSGVNNKIPASALASFLGVTGTILPVGTAGVPILEQPGGSVNNIRTFESGFGILASVSPTNGISVKQNITVNAIGSEVIVDKNIASPVFRSFVAGSGMVVGISGDTIVLSTSAVGAGSTVIINQESDFPTAIGGIITLEDNTNYIIASAVSTANRFVLGTNNSFTANNLFTPLLTYTGAGVMFTGVDVNFTISEISVNCPNGTVIDMSSPTAVIGNIYLSRQFIVISCAKYANFNNIRTLDITDSSVISATQGMTISGNTKWSIFSLFKFAIISTSASFVAVDFTTSLHQTLEISDAIFRGPVGAIGLKGAAASANVSAGNLATVAKSEFSGGLTPLDTLTNSDIRWDYSLNTGVADTLSDALLGFNGSATETVISIIDTPVIVNATWVIETSSKFTVTTGGRATYNGEQDSRFPVDIAISLKASSGGAINASIYLALNGTVVTNTKRTVEVSNTLLGHKLIPWQLSLSKDDFLEVFVENNSNTINLIVDEATMRVN